MFYDAVKHFLKGESMQKLLLSSQNQDSLQGGRKLMETETKSR